MSVLIDPTAPAGFGLKPASTVMYSEFAEKMQTLFYRKREGPAVVFNGDCLMC